MQTVLYICNSYSVCSKIYRRLVQFTVMIFEIDEENRDFISVSKEDFYPKKARRPSQVLQRADYLFPLNPLNGPFKDHLNSQRNNLKLEPAQQSEDIKANLERVKCLHPNLKKVLVGQTPDEDVIELREKKASKSVYLLDYSENLDNYLSLTSRRTGGDRPRVTLPEGWVLPETVQRISYRNPQELAPELVSNLVKREKPRDNLVPNENERRILKVTTGESNYAATIGTLGEKIIENHFHGQPLPLYPPVDDKGLDSNRSNCSIILMNSKYPNLSNIF